MFILACRRRTEQIATANIYDEDGKLLKTLDVGEWSYNRGQTGFWFYGVTWFTDDGLVGIDDYAA